MFSFLNYTHDSNFRQKSFVIRGVQFSYRRMETPRGMPHGIHTRGSPHGLHTVDSDSQKHSDSRHTLFFSEDTLANYPFLY